MSFLRELPPAEAGGSSLSGNVGSFGLILDGSDGFNDVSGNGHHFGAFNGVQLDQNDLPPFI